MCLFRNVILPGPAIEPGTGTYSAARTVTITPAAGPPSTVRYTLDGSTPTATSTIYSAPFTVNTAMTVNARSFSNDRSAGSAIATSTLNFNYGTLPLPGASPVGGVFAAAPQVTLTSIAGATLRYTLDGTTPTGTSALYTGAIPIPSAGATLKSIAFHPDWTASAVRTDVYTVDATAPTITAQFLPAHVNAWNRTPVTVNFHCFDNVQVASCSTPAMFNQEGVGQTATGTAVDAAGNQTQLPVTLNLDFAPPTVSITSPVNGLVTSNTTLAITGQAADALSGLAAVSCNGVAASVTNGAVSCSVTLRPGRNVVVVAARDLAGHSASSGVTVTLAGTMTQLTLNPSERTMLVNETGTLTLRDEFGVAPANATWQTGNAAIVSLSADNPPVLTAVAAGTVTITASKSGLSAGATITVVAGETLPTGEVRLPAGTTRWNLPTVTSTQSRRTAPIYTHRSQANGPDLFTVEPNTLLTEFTMRAVTADGEVLWKEAAPGLPLMGDAYGAAVAGVPGAYRCAAYYGEDRFCFTALVRFAGTETVGPWRYESAGYLDRPAQGPDGTIFAIEHIGGGRSEVLDQPDYGNNKSVVMLDGATGQVTGRVSFAPETQLTACGLTENEPLTIGPIVGADGNGYVAVRQRHRSYSGPCNDPPSQVLITDDETWTLLRLSRTGELARAVVDECHMSCGALFSPQQLLPDGTGGLVLNGTRWLSHLQVNEQRLVRLDAELVRSDFVLPSSTRIDLVGQSGTLFLQTTNGTNPNATTQAFDIRAGATLWAKSPGYTLVAAHPDNGGAGQGSNGALFRITATGEPAETLSTTQVIDPVQFMGNWVGNGTATVRTVAGIFEDATHWDATRVAVGTGFYEARGFGASSMQSATRLARFVAFVPPNNLANQNSPPYPPIQYEVDFRGDISQQRIIGSTRFFNAGQATARSFIDLVKVERDAVAFIGHSLLLEPSGSVGLVLSGGAIVKQMSPQPIGPFGVENDIRVVQIQTTPKIIFIAACDTRSVFESLWDISASTTNRALIVPTVPLTDLYWSAQAWRKMADSLSKGKTVAAAVSDGNAYLAGNQVNLSFTVIGGSSVRIR